MILRVWPWTKIAEQGVEREKISLKQIKSRKTYQKSKANSSCCVLCRGPQVLEILHSLCVTKFNSGQWMDSSPWLRTCTFIGDGLRFPCKKFHQNMMKPLIVLLTDLAPVTWVFLFPKCKMVVRGQHWKETTRKLKSLNTEDYQGCFNQWKSRWNKCMKWRAMRRVLLRGQNWSSLNFVK